MKRLWFCLVLLFGAVPAFAGTVTIQTTMTTFVSQDRFWTRAMVANNGDSQAHLMDAVLTVFGQTLKGRIAAPGSVTQAHSEAESSMRGIRFQAKTQVVGPGRGVIWHFQTKRPANVSGTYPASLLISYEDESSQPISAAACHVFTISDNALPAAIEVSAKDITLDKKGLLRVIIKNPAGIEKKMLASLVLPNEVSCADNKRRLIIKPQGSQTLEFNLKHENDLLGSHAVFCFVEYDDKDMHYTAMAEAIIKTGPQKRWFSRNQNFLLGLTALLVVLFFIALIWDRKSKFSRKGPENKKVSR